MYSSFLFCFCLLFALSKAVWVDLSYLYNEITLNWPMTKKFESEHEYRRILEDGTWYATNRFCSGEHSGTHLDAPFHFSETGWRVDQIPLDYLVDIEAVVVDITARVTGDDVSNLNKDDLLNWEANHGRIPNNSIVIMRSGWEKNWGNFGKFYGSEEGSNMSTYRFPAVDTAAAEWLVTNRSIIGFGLDTPSVDSPGVNVTSHVTICERNIYILENLANLAALPEAGARLYIMPMKIEGGTGAPCRVVAKLED